MVTVLGFCLINLIPQWSSRADLTCLGSLQSVLPRPEWECDGAGPSIAQVGSPPEKPVW